MAISKARRIWRVCLISLIVVMAAALFWGWRRGRPEAVWERAMAARQAGRFESARLNLLSLLQKAPEHAAGHRALAEVLLEEAKAVNPQVAYAGHPAALEHLQRAWELAPEDIDAAKPLLEAYVARGQLKDAEQIANAVLEQEPNNPTALRTLAARAIQEKDYAAAEHTLSTLDSLPGEPSPQTLRLQAALYQGLENDERLDAVLRQAVDMAEQASSGRSPQDAAALYELVLQATARATAWPEAGRRAATALAMLHGQPAAGGAVAQWAIQLSQTLALISAPTPADQAERQKIFSRVVELAEPALDSGDLPVSHYRGLCAAAFSAGDEEKALALLKKTLASLRRNDDAPQGADLDLHLLAAEQLVARRKFRSAEAHIKVLLSDHRGVGYGRLLQGQIALAEGRLAPALRNYDRARKELGSTLPVRLGMAGVLVAMEEWREALPYLAMLNVNRDELSPSERAWAEQTLGDGEGVHLLQARAHLALGEEEKAAIHIKALEETPLEPQGVALRVSNLWNKGEADEAMDLLQAARRWFPDDLSLARMQCVLLVQQGEPKEAEAVIYTLAEREPDNLAAQLLLLRWLLARDEQQKAESHLDVLRERFPDQPAVQLADVQRSLRRGDAAAAMQIAEKMRQDADLEQAGNMIGALSAMRLQNLDGAAGLLASIDRSEREQGAVYLLQANLALSRGDTGAAIESLHTAMKFDKLRSTAAKLAHRAALSMAAKDRDAAMARLKRIIADYPEEVSLLMAQVDLEAQQGRYSDAMRTLAKVQELAPRSSVPAMARARMYLLVDQPQEALQELEALLAASPEETQARRMAAQAALAADPEAALEHARAGRQRSPQDVTFALLEAAALQKLKRSDEAEEALHALLQQQPRLVQGWLALAQIHASAGDHDEALRTLARGREQAEGSALLMQRSIAMLCERGEHDEADQLAQEFAGEEPELAAVVQLAQSYLSAGRFDRAREWAVKAQDLAEGDNAAEAKLLLGDIDLQAGRATDDPDERAKHFAQARRHYQATWEHDSSSLAAANNLVWLLTQSGDLEEAMQVAEKVRDDASVASAPNELIDTLINLYAQTGDREKLQSLLDQAAAVRPNRLEWLRRKLDLAGDEKEVEQLLDEFVSLQEQQPWTPEPSYAAASAAARLDETEKSLEHLDRALRIDRGHLPSHLLAMRQLSAAGEWALVLDHADAALEVDPRQWNIRLLKSHALKELGREDDAKELAGETIEQLNAEIEEEPLDDKPTPEQTRWLVELHKLHEQPEEALAVLSAACERRPDDLSLFNLRLEELVAQEKRDEAKQLAQAQAEEVATADEALRVGRVLYSVRLLEEAEICASKAMQMAAEETQTAAHLLAGDVALARGEATADQVWFEQARDHYRQVLADQPRNLVAGNNLSWLLLKHLEQPQEALAAAEQVRGGAPTSALHPSFIDTLAEVYRAADKMEEARLLMEEAVAAYPENAVIHFQHGMTLLAAGQRYTARDALQQALELGLSGEQQDEAERELEALDKLSGG